MWVALGVIVSFCACAEARDDDDLTRAVSEFISAVESENWDAAWSLTSADAQEELLAFHRLLYDAVTAVPLIYPESSRDTAATAVGRELIAEIKPSDSDLGPQFMSRRLHPSALRFDQQARDGLLSAKSTIEGDRATLVTGAGETFTFERSAG
ncbi:MAG: hypothetical protein VYE15_00365, partial [Myxococcota bacterium]|nr:hypothetical protein [Myxococcota bacterium]